MRAKKWCRCIARETYHVPPLFLAPSLFPAPSFAELAAPWALCEAWRTPMLVVLVELAKAGVDRRKALRAVSMVAMAGEEPVGSARILGSNMVRAVCVVALVQRSNSMSLCCCARLSTFCRLRNCVENGCLCWQRFGLHYCFLSSQPTSIDSTEGRQETFAFATYREESDLSIDHPSHPTTDALSLARPSARSTPPLPCALSRDS
jgi:hypothetical protein